MSITSKTKGTKTVKTPTGYIVGVGDKVNVFHEGKVLQGTIVVIDPFSNRVISGGVLVKLDNWEEGYNQCIFSGFQSNKDDLWGFIDYHVISPVKTNGLLRRIFNDLLFIYTCILAIGLKFSKHNGKFPFNARFSIIENSYIDNISRFGMFLRAMKSKLSSLFVWGRSFQGHTFWKELSESQYE